MVVKISVKNDFERVASQLAREFPRKAEIAQQRALLKIAQAVKDESVKLMQGRFDRPTRFTLNALAVKLDKPKMEARVEVKDGYWIRADNYLETQIEGRATRKQKAFERALQRVGALPAGWVAVPGEAATLDAYGNMSVGQIKQIMSWFDASEPFHNSSDRNMGQKGRDKRRKGTRTKRGFEYFAALPGHRVGRGSWRHGRVQNLQPGIYKRTHFGFGSAIQPVLIFARSAGYRERYPFYKHGQVIVDRVGPQILRAAIEREFAR